MTDHSPDHAERARDAWNSSRTNGSQFWHELSEAGRERLVAMVAALSLPAAALRGRDRVVEAAQFLSDRLDDLEWMDGELESTCRDYMGHVDPAHDRLKTALHDAKDPRP